MGISSLTGPSQLKHNTNKRVVEKEGRKGGREEGRGGGRMEEREEGRGGGWEEDTAGQVRIA